MSDTLITYLIMLTGYLVTILCIFITSNENRRLMYNEVIVKEMADVFKRTFELLRAQLSFIGSDLTKTRLLDAYKGVDGSGFIGDAKRTKEIFRSLCMYGSPQMLRLASDLQGVYLEFSLNLDVSQHKGHAIETYNNSIVWMIAMNAVLLTVIRAQFFGEYYVNPLIWLLDENGFNYSSMKCYAKTISKVSLRYRLFRVWISTGVLKQRHDVESILYRINSDIPR